MHGGIPYCVVQLDWFLGTLLHGDGAAVLIRAFAGHHAVQSGIATEDVLVVTWRQPVICSMFFCVCFEPSVTSFS